MGAAGWLTARGARRQRPPEPLRAGHRWLARLAGALVLAGVLAFAPGRLGGASGPGRTERLREELVRVGAARDALRDENAALRREIEALRTDPAAIEEIARDDLGMVRLGDMVLRLVGGEPGADPAPEAVP
jgi:cell division protein FtsB